MVHRGVLLLLAGVCFAAPARAQNPLLAARDLPRGTVLAAADIMPGPAAADTPPVSGDAEADRRPGPGWITRRVIARGEPLRAPAVVPPLLVEPGQTVQFVWASGTVELRLSGRAMGPARMGERVLVQIDSRRRLEGIASGPALVRMQPNSGS